MTLITDRRSVVLGALGLGALALPASRGLAAGLLGARGFTHSVASGEPGADSMLLWTRYVPAAGEGVIRLEAEIALDPEFSRVVSGGSVQTGSYRDWTAKILVDGPEPGKVYWYRFIAPDGSKSPTGRTKTLPVGDVPRFGLGVFSCSNLPVGWFNAYGHAAGRTDLDLWLHVGDYLYESAGAQHLPGRVVDPPHEMVALADYRLRFACYRADPDLQALHQNAPMVALWDDHETTNDSWEGGAQNHQPQTEGDWDVRRAASIQAYREWMPVSDEPWKAYPLGALATLYRTESRLLARTQQLQLDDLRKALGSEQALRAFRDGPWMDPSATMLGSVQESWLAHQMKANARSSAWQLVGMATNLGRVLIPEEMPGWMRSDAPSGWMDALRLGVPAAKLGMPSFFDAWGGYPAARTRLFRAAQAADADLVMLTGDSHNGWAFDFEEDGQPVGVEFGGHSVTSGGLDNVSSADPAVMARALVSASKELKWADTSQRGYMMLDITPQRVTGEWLFMRTVKTRTTALAGVHRMQVERGRRAFSV